MAWMVAVILILFYVIGRFAFHETSLSAYLPYLAGGLLIVDYLLAHFFERQGSARSRD